MFCQKYDCYFIHIQKIAGSSIVHFFSNNNIATSEPEHQSHMSAKDFTYIYPKYKQNRAFTFIRNPWDRALSSFRNLLYNRNRPDGYALMPPEIKNEIHFDTFIYAIKEGHIGGTACQLHYITDNQLCLYHINPLKVYQKHPYLNDNKDNVIVDNLYRFEDLHEEWKRVCVLFGVPHIELSKKNMYKIRDKVDNPKHYSKYYDDKMEEELYNLYHEEIDYFGYTFEGI